MEFGIISQMPKAYMYQILNHYTPRESLDHGFRVLDNSRNERPDWYEYWPIRNFLLGGDLEADAYYGFFSPKLRHKTNLTAALIEDFIAASDGTLDVIGFTPNIYNSAHYLNVFEHGDAKHPGLLDLAQRVFERLGRPTDLKGLITDSRTEVYSNYFVAKPRFWAEWLAINEAVFALAESAADPLGAELRAPTSYRGSVEVPIKIFLIERVATWILASDLGFRARASDPFVTRARPYKLPVAIVCDALKIAYATQGHRQYLTAFHLVGAFRRCLNLQIRSAALFGSEPVRSSLRELAGYWARSGAKRVP